MKQLNTILIKQKNVCFLNYKYLKQIKTNIICNRYFVLNFQFSIFNFQFKNSVFLYAVFIIYGFFKQNY